MLKNVLENALDSFRVLKFQGLLFLFSYFMKSIFMVIFASCFVVAYAQINVDVQVVALEEQQVCTDGFVEHALEHTTKASGDQVTFFDSNGSGLALGDLDNDNDIDIVLANLAGNSSILWNEGNLEFRKEILNERQARAVAAVDIDGDGWLELLFSHSTSGITQWKYIEGSFKRIPLSGLRYPSYSFLVSDIDNDNDLDIITASYDTVLEKALGNGFLTSGGAGVAVNYQQADGSFKVERLEDSAQALALTLFDVNQDGQQDLIVGNDFDIPDWVWLNKSDSWQKQATDSIFSRITQNTMSFDSGDIDNNGTLELFATDMKPDFNNLKAVAQWTPLMQKGFERLLAHDTQRPENTLQVFKNNSFENQAYKQRLDATGWSWSAKFADLDNDGWQDLYVVNGMIAKDVFEHLDSFELTEENHVFQNQQGRFTPNKSWNLNSQLSGRGMSMADLDNDGDNDIVVNTLESSARLFENQLCHEGNSFEIDLRWLASKNTRALGSTIELITIEGMQRSIQRRDITSLSGYLSGNSSRVHFGVAQNATIEQLDITWSDGEHTVLSQQEYSDALQVNQLVSIHR